MERVNDIGWTLGWPGLADNSYATWLGRSALLVVRQRLWLLPFTSSCRNIIVVDISWLFLGVRLDCIFRCSSFCFIDKGIHGAGKHSVIHVEDASWCSVVYRWKEGPYNRWTAHCTRALGFVGGRRVLKFPNQTTIFFSWKLRKCTSTEYVDSSADLPGCQHWEISVKRVVPRAKRRRPERGPKGRSLRPEGPTV